MKKATFLDRVRKLGWRMALESRLWWPVRSFFMNRIWSQYLRPHFQPRTWFKEQYEHLVEMRIPAELHVFIYEVEDYGETYFNIKIADSPEYNWSMWCCLFATTEEEARKIATEVIEDYAEHAGVMTEDGNYDVIFHNTPPTPEWEEGIKTRWEKAREAYRKRNEPSA